MLRVVIIKPSKYGVSGHVERFRRGFMPNSTVPYIRSMTPESVDGVPIETVAIDEYVQTDLQYLDVLRNPDQPTLLALVGVQSHQFQRSLDLAAFARAHGVRHCVIGGPHPMTCDTTMLQNTGVSFALAEAEIIWYQILKDAIHGELQPVYGRDQRWTQQIDAPVIVPPSKKDLQRYIVPMLGIYPARGCPFTCNFCSVIKIAGRAIRSQSIETTMTSLRRAKAAGVRLVMFTSDNFNKYAEAKELLEQMIEEKINIPFFVQCDTQVAKQEELIHLLGRAGCFEMFVGVESFSRKTLLAAHKTQNYPTTYADIVQLCRKHQVVTHFSNIIGFPDDTEQTVREHVAILRELAPDVGSFYILCPIPGTEQYDDFMASGWISEQNMDRFDGTTSTWRHPTLSGKQLQEMLFTCYREFHSVRHMVKTAVRTLRYATPAGVLPCLGHPLFCRYSAWQKRHPMSGGVGLVQKDSAADYLEFRKKQFNLERIPLPKSLELSAADAELNRRVKLAI
ncbi:MAG TPA: B12-binding domain-containing radical SAM protein [Terriglobia bacterium]|nr:B12-binding domain-containing radical SAM protein [Terriglobia bacterium]